MVDSQLRVLDMQTGNAHFQRGLIQYFMKAHHRDGERVLGEAIRLLMFGKAIEARYWLCNSELKPMLKRPKP